MHRLFREQLDDAVGTSEFVVALNLDIRGFSDWSLSVDSAPTALYVKKLYAVLIDRYFKEASFIKPTGDGLLVVLPFEEKNLKDVVATTVRNAMEIVDGFGGLVSADPMINFPVPEKVGIGIARGTASRLGTEERTLDYSGRVLNLASRLMDLARPRGVVLDGDYGFELLPADLAGNFRAEAVYLKGVAPIEPLTSYCWPTELEIPPAHLQPLQDEDWKHVEMTATRRELETAAAKLFRLTLDPPPAAGMEVVCSVTHDAVTPGGRKSQRLDQAFAFAITRGEVAGEKIARFDQHALAEKLKASGVGPTWPITVQVSYRVS